MMGSREAEAVLMLQQMFRRVDEICEILGVDRRVQVMLKDFDSPYERPFRVTFARLGEGPGAAKVELKTEHYHVIRVRHVNPWATGHQPFGGGLRYDSSVTLPLMKVDAMKMTFKHTLVGPHDHERIPFGGAKGGVAVDPRLLSWHELVQLTQEVVQKLNPVIGPHVDRVAPDMGTNEKIMDEFMTHYATLNAEKNIPCGAIASGKSLDNFGCPGRLTATAEGMLDVLEYFRGHDAFSAYFKKAPRTIIVGMGNVGGWFLKFAKDHGLNVVGVADIHGALYRKDGGLEEEADTILKLASSKEGIAAYSEAEHCTLEELLAQDCDMLVPAASEGMITSQVASKMKARILLEGANNPTDEEALPILRENDVLTIPDILANAGGATVSYFEWLQGVRGQQYELEDIQAKRKAYLVGGAKRTVEAADKYKTDLRTGAMIASIDFIARRLMRKHHWE
ncbi:MAG: Glu/Leu/Phe/Val dehydrogenase dimerization domain-containing protein [bacterium]|nr:Glu/Leu/Phe/Val dehydrogenase dimerization domain-containing protein [bacterium]